MGNFGKTFLLTLLTFVAVNVGGWLIVLFLNGEILNIISHITDLSKLSGALFGPISETPGWVIGGYIEDSSETYTYFGFLGDLLSGSTTINLGTIIGFVFYIAAPLLAVIVAGKMGDRKGDAFGGWLLAASICIGAALTLTLLGGVGQSVLLITILTIIIAGVGNIFFYGSIALLLHKHQFY